MKYLELLRGRKTYILSGIGLLVLGANMLGFVDQESTVAILSLLGVGGLATLRAAISNIGSK
jgi:hypothetical protein